MLTGPKGEVEVVDFCNRFLDKYHPNAREILKTSGKQYLVISFSDIIEYDPEFAEYALEYFPDFYSCMKMALSFDMEGHAGYDICVKNLPKSARSFIKDLRSKEFGKLIAVEGIIKSTTKVQPRVWKVETVCPNCGQKVTIMQEERKIKVPRRCSCGRRGDFIVEKKEYVDIQKLELEETAERIQEATYATQRVRVYLEGIMTDPSLTRAVQPGNHVILSGYMMELPKFFLPTDDDTTMKDMIFKANYIQVVETAYEEVVLTQQDIDKIIEMAKDPDIIDKMTASVAPTIYGLVEVKEAVLLQQFGGVKKIRPDGTISRSIFHLLLIGEPSTAKSKLLEYMKNIAPRARLATGGAATRAGITAGIIKDQLTGSYALEAGALVLAHKGLLLLDEADKMSPEDSSSLHEAMESGRVTRNGAGISATLPAETSILAAANPKFGRFDMNEPLAKQIEMPISLLSRFDAIFPVKDIPNSENDSRLAMHILKSHSTPEKITSEIAPEMIKKYIAYARKMEPKLTQEAIDDIHKFYVNLRSKANYVDGGTVKSIPITPRQLEAIIRLSEASAKARLSLQVEILDVARAKRLIWYYLTQLGMTESGTIDIDKIQSSIAASERSKAMIIKELLIELTETIGKEIPIMDIVREAGNRGIQSDEVEHLLDKLRHVGDIMEPKRGFIQKL